jgi:peptidoglycan hydrolase-like protein with peptidoglycan-binding domain
MQTFLMRTILLGCFLSLMAPKGEAKRVALVIGNSAYGPGLELKNPGNDAARISADLRKLDFTVLEGKDLTIQAMEDAILQFSRMLEKGDVAWFFYSGHGLQVEKVNYLLPIGSEVREAFEAKQKAMDVEYIRGAMAGAGTQLNVLVLDCCRENPFARKWTRSMTKGMAPVQAKAEGEIIAYATSANTVAQDGDGDNSPFTEQLAAVLESRPPEGLEVKDVFLRTGRAMKKRYEQRPQIEMDAALENYYLDRTMDGAVLADATGTQVPLAASTESRQVPIRSVPLAVLPPAAGNRDIATAGAPVGAVIAPPPGGALTLDTVFSSSPYSEYNSYSKKSILSKAQAKMKTAGVYHSAVDGSMGKGTSAAIVAWQNSRGLTPNGLLDRPTLETLSLLGLAEQAAPVKRTTSSRSSSSSGDSFGLEIRDAILQGIRRGNLPFPPPFPR